MAIPGGVHKNYDDGGAVIIASTNASMMKVRFDGGLFEKIDELVMPGFEGDFASEEEVRALIEKLDANYMNEEATLEIFDAYMDKVGLSKENAPNGLYTLADMDGHVYAGYATTLFKVSDVDPSQKANSKIAVSKSLDVTTKLDPEKAKGVNRFLGINITYDGYIVVAMPGLVAVLDRDLNEIFPAYIEGEAVDNGLCVDPDGGIYLVTSKYMRKLVWTGDKLSMDEADGAWKETYDYVPDKEGGLWL